MNKIQLNFYQCIQLLTALTEKGLIHKDPDNPNNIFVYRNAGKTSPEGFYSENLLSTASDLAKDSSAQQYLVSKLEEQTGEPACFSKDPFEEKEPFI